MFPSVFGNRKPDPKISVSVGENRPKGQLSVSVHDTGVLSYTRYVMASASSPYKRTDVPGIPDASVNFRPCRSVDRCYLCTFHAWKCQLLETVNPPLSLLLAPAPLLLYQPSQPKACARAAPCTRVLDCIVVFYDPYRHHTWRSHLSKPTRLVRKKVCVICTRYIYAIYGTHITRTVRGNL